MKKAIKIVLSLLFSILLGYYALADINWSEFFKSCQTIKLLPLLWIIIIFFIQIALRAYRWKFLINEYKPTSIKLRFDSIMISNFINFILPLRAGEFARPIFLSNFSQNSFTAGLSSVIIERLFDLSTVLISYAILVFFSDYNFNLAIKYSALTLSLMALMMIFGIVFLILYKELSKKIINRIAKFLPSKISKILLPFILNLVDAVGVLKNIKNIFIVSGLSIAIWLITFWQFEVAFLIFGLDIPDWFGMLVAVTIALAVAAPSAPGFIGVYQGAVLFAFLLLNLSKEQAAVYSLVTHIHQYLLVIIYGIYVLISYKINFKNLLSKKN